MSAPTRRRGLIVGLILLGAAAVGIALAAIGPFGGQGSSDRSATTAAVTDVPEPDAPGASELPTVPIDPATAPPATGPDAVSPAEPPSDPLVANPGAGVEVLPPVESNPDEPALPPSDPLPPLLKAPAPETATAEGALVAGFPAFITPAPQSTVAASMVASEGANVQAAFSATSRQAAEDVRAYFDKIFGALTLHPSVAPAVGGSSAWVYSRGAESVTVTLTPTASGCNYSILATFVAV
ncbi:MAG: hypothetical protein ABWY68_08665 [Cryobacterium sp.]